MLLRGACLAVICAMGAPAGQDAAANSYFEQARRLFEQRQLDGAEAAASKALAADPHMANAEILLGLIATVRSRLPEAEKHFAHAAALAPQNYQAHAYLGSTYLQEKRLEAAAASFRKVLELNPGNAAAHYNLGLIALERRAPSEALPHFEAAARGNGSDVAAWIGVLESQLLLRRPSGVRETAGRIAALLDDRDPRLFQLAALLAQHGESALALPLMERAHRVLPQSYDVSYNLALALLETGQADRAAEVLEPFLGQQGKAEAFELMGSIEEKRGRADQAERAFEEASRREPSNADYRFDYGNSLVQHGKLAAGVAAFRAAASDQPGAWKLRVGLGSACYLSGSYEEAAEALLEAVRLKPDSVAAYFLLGETYESSGRFQPAIEASLQDYVKTGPRDPWAYYHYGAVLYARAQAQGRKEFPEAAANLERSLRLEPKFAEAQYELGVIALARDQTAQAIERLETAVRLDPKLAPAHYRLGLAYQRLGNAARAKEELERFRALKQEAPYRRRVLESLTAIGR